MGDELIMETKDFFKKIQKESELDNYKGYKSSKLKMIKDLVKGGKIKEPVVFDKEKIIELLKNNSDLNKLVKQLKKTI